MHPVDLGAAGHAPDPEPYSPAVGDSVVLAPFVELFGSERTCSCVRVDVDAETVSRFCGKAVEPHCFFSVLGSCCGDGRVGTVVCTAPLASPYIGTDSDSVRRESVVDVLVRLEKGPANLVGRWCCWYAADDVSVISRAAFTASGSDKALSGGSHAAALEADDAAAAPFARGPVPALATPSLEMLEIPSATYRRLFALAAQHGHAERARALLEHLDAHGAGEHRRGRENHPSLAIATAAAAGHTAVVEVLLESAWLLPSSLGEAAAAAARLGFDDVLQLLYTDPRTPMPSLWPLQDRAFYEIARRTHSIFALRLMLSDPHCRVNGTYPNYDNGKPLRCAAAYGFLDGLDALLSDPRVDPTAYRTDVLRFAAHNDELACVERLLEDPRIDVYADACGAEALRHAVTLRHSAVVERLLLDHRLARLGGAGRGVSSQSLTARAAAMAWARRRAVVYARLGAAQGRRAAGAMAQPVSCDAPASTSGAAEASK